MLEEEEFDGIFRFQFPFWDWLPSMGAAQCHVIWSFDILWKEKPDLTLADKRQHVSPRSDPHRRPVLPSASIWHISLPLVTPLHQSFIDGVSSSDLDFKLLPWILMIMRILTLGSCHESMSMSYMYIVQCKFHIHWFNLKRTFKSVHKLVRFQTGILFVVQNQKIY